MGDDSSGSPPPSPAEEKEAWRTYTADDLKRMALSLQNDTALHFGTFQDFIIGVKSQYKSYEDAFFNRFKNEIIKAQEHPGAAVGVAFAASFLFFRGPRRFLFRQTVGRFQNEEAIYTKADSRVKELNQSVDLVKKDSHKLRQRASFAEEEVNKGYLKLKKCGDEIQRLAKSVMKIESEAADLMDGLREIPGREAIKLRAEVVSMTSQLKQQKTALKRRIIKISDLGVPI